MNDFWIDIEEVDPDLNLRKLQVLVEDTTSGVITFGAFQRVADREAAVRWMKEELKTPVREVRLSKETKNPLTLLQKIPDEPRCCVQIYDLEDALPEVLGYINYGREAYLEIPHALVFWVGPHGLEQVARKAPDFWSWRSGVFDVRTESPDVAASVTQHAMMSSIRYTDHGDLERKASLYEKLISEQLEQDEPREDYIARLRERLITVLSYLRRFDEMERQATWLLEWASDNDARMEAAAYHSLGLSARQRRDLDEAERFFQQALNIGQNIHGEYNLVALLNQLGDIEQKRDNLDAARHLFQKSLNLAQHLSDEYSTAITLYQIGTVAQKKGDFITAKRFFQKALDILQSLGQEYGLARVLHQLGTVSHIQRDLDGAERLFQQALDIKQRLNDEHGVAITLAHTGFLQAERGQYDAALDLLAQSRAVFVEQNDPHLSERVDKEVSRILVDAPTDQREALKQQWLDRGHPPVWEDEGA